FGEWTAANSSPDSNGKFFFGTMLLFSAAVGKIQLKGLVTDSSKSEPLVKEFLHILNQNLAIKCEVKRTTMSWLDFALKPFPDIFYPGKTAFKVKDGFLNKPFTDEQAKTIYHYLTGWKNLKGILVGIATYGGQVNAVDGDTTATVQRKAIFATSCTAGWIEPEEAEAYMSWVREAYQSLWSDQGGAPVPGSQAGGCIIAHPDNDLADPQLNKSGTPWHAFYYQQHYSRLQQIKSKYDPLNIFHHALSIEPAPL
ncbi:MAG: BBE domain-containing protein, partial [Ferruginibacter sp.]